MSPRLHALLDRFGATGSLLCALHCALLPVVIALLPTVGVASLLGERFELAFVAFASAVGLYSVVSGYRRHRLWQALALMLPGLLILWGGLGADVIDGGDDDDQINGLGGADFLLGGAGRGVRIK